MRIILVLAALFTLAGCESMDFVAVDYHSGYNYGPYFQPTNHISYTLGYYSGSHYNGYRVYGNHGHRYYHAPRGYSNHRHFSRPVVVHQHVHTSYCEHNYRPRNHYTPPVVRNDPPRHTPPRSTPPRSTPPRRTPPRTAPPRQREDRVVNNERREPRVVNNERRENRADRQRDKKRKRK